MSCVIGLVAEGKIWFGADGFATTEDGERRPIVCNKIIKNGDYMFGYTGSVRTGQILREELFTPPDDILMLPDALREYYTAAGCMADAEGMNAQTCNFLIAWQDRLYEILMDYQLNEVLGDYTAIGSGAQVAMGAMYAMQYSRKMQPISKLERALKASAFFNTAVGPPYDYDYV